MEEDSFEQNKKFFITGLLCLSLGLILFALSIYIFPYLIFNWRYKIPDMIQFYLDYLQFAYNLKSTAAGWLIFLGIFFSSIILFVIADLLSHKVNNKEHDNSYKKDYNSRVRKYKKVEEQESTGLVFKIIMIIILVFIASQLFQWAISI